MANFLRRTVERGSLALAAATAVALGGVACASPEKPPVATAPAVPGDPSPSEGKPVETPDNGEKDPLSPENLWSMSEEEQLEAVRIPEGTLPEEWVRLYAKYKEALLNAAASDKAYREWDADPDKNGRGVNDCSMYVYSKIEPALHQLSGGPTDKNGYERLVLYRACATNFHRDLTKGYNLFQPPEITYEAKMVKEYKGGAMFKSTFYDNVTKEDIELVKKYALNVKSYEINGGYVMSKEPVMLAADTLRYNEEAKTMQPRNIYPALESA